MGFAHQSFLQEADLTPMDKELFKFQIISYSRHGHDQRHLLTSNSIVYTILSHGELQNCSLTPLFYQTAFKTVYSLKICFIKINSSMPVYGCTETEYLTLPLQIRNLRVEASVFAVKCLLHHQTHSNRLCLCSQFSFAFFQHQ